MIQHSLLAQIAAQYNFDQANQIMALPQSKALSRYWMTLELSLPLSRIFNGQECQYACSYQQAEEYYKYNLKSQQVAPCEKRAASKADLKLVTSDTTSWFEFHTLHQEELESTKERNKLYEDVKRIKALRSVLPNDNILLFIGLWGRFSGEDMQHFQPLDNHHQCAYVLDSGLTGSGQISRLCQMKKGGTERFLLAAF
ncbi:hypothetical protein [Marinomonas sp. THO17]|uniref:hypothetical protein n=1 Tax=Marinomonas sp. THO17 TaxID=3149048 RepID=UPI00336C0349